MKNKKFVTCDGNYAAAHISYMFSEVAAVYPITPSSNMAEYVDEWSTAGRKNLFGQTLKVIEMQSEAGAAGATHGSLQAGALTSTYTASQGLLLMIPNMYKIAGELLPSVFHVSARSLAAQALSIFGDHSDVMSARQTGFAMLASGSVQEVMDLSPVAHLSTLKASIPFLNFFDGFRTSHEIQKIEMIEEEDMAKLIDMEAVQKFRDKALNPEHPVTRGTAENPDIYFQTREAQNKFYNAIPDIVENYMKEISKITGREYHPFTYYGDANAENIIVAMGSVTETIKETIDYLRTQGKKVGLITVHLYRPFSLKYFFNVLPKSVKKIAVIDRTKEHGANGEPLYLDIRDAFYGKENSPVIIGGRYGLSSKDTTPAQIIAIYENLEKANPKTPFTIGIVDDVTNLSLEIKEEVSVAPKGTFEAKFYGLGSDGTVGANKNSIKIIGDSTNKYCQAYFAYDSKKSGGITISHLRFGDEPIRSTYLVNTPDFVACHVPSYLDKYDMLQGLKKGGTFLLNSIWNEEETKNHLPDKFKKYLAENDIKFYVINATAIAEEIGLGNRTNTIMQAAFFKIANVIPYEKAIEQMKKAIVKSFGKKGEDIVNMNYKAVDKGGEVKQIAIPSEWKNIQIKEHSCCSCSSSCSNVPAFVKNIVMPINSLKGDSLPVSAFNGYEDGTFPQGTTKYEKRSIAVNVPEWQSEKCIQCNQCAYVCPHAVIRPFLLTEEEAKNVPAGTVLQEGKGPLKDYKFRIQVSLQDCTGCGVCADICPSKEKALIMKPYESQKAEAERWEYMHNKVGYKAVLDKFANIKNSQFAQPLFEFSGACAGCGETPYIKTITQLFGDRMIIANATGCSSIYGGSAPVTPYTTNSEGRGPAWANSLFEDNAEYGYGIASGINQLRNRIAEKMSNAIANGSMSAETKVAMQEWINGKNDADASEKASTKLIECLKKENDSLAKEILSLKQYLIKKSVWIFGGDGWAYDIGFGGLDHVIASGEDVNILVLDTEVYSNTGGQASKSTPVGAVAKLASAGMRMRKKDLGAIAMTYGYVYVAQVSLGADMNQYFKVLKEAEAYKGPSLIIAYAPCIAHGIRSGMNTTSRRQKQAVECGYWVNYRHNPMLEIEGKNPFVIDSKEPNFDNFQGFIGSEVRYNSLSKAVPTEAADLFKRTEEDAKWRYKQYQNRANII